MIPKHVANPELDTEYMASKVLSGLDYPTSYVDLRNYISYIKIVDSKTELDAMYQIFIDDMVDESGLLNDAKVLKFWEGEYSQAFSTLTQMLILTETAILEHDARIERTYQESYRTLEENAYGDYQQQANSVMSVIPLANYMNQLDVIKQDLRRNSASISHTMELYGSGAAEELLTKKIKAEYSKEYAFFCIKLLNNMPDVIHNADLARVLTTTISTLEMLYPQDTMDPYKVDEFNNLLYLLTNPKKLKSEYRTDEIISDTVGQAFFSCYPEFSQLFADSYIDKYDKMSYQDRIVFNKCVGNSNADPSLIQFCAVHQTSQPQGGM